MKLFCLSVLFTCLLTAGFNCQAQTSASESKISGTKCDLTSEDYAVYTSVVQNLGVPEDPEEAWSGKEILIADQTAQTSKDEIAWSGLGMRSRSDEKPKEETLADFRQKSSAKCTIETHFSDSSHYSLLQQQELDKTFEHGPRGWTDFYKKHPKAGGYWDFSRPGYDAKAQEAVLYVGHHCGGLCGTGHLFLLRKKDGNWKVVARSMLWIS